MGGNREHGYRRGNRGGIKPEPWYCAGCARWHEGLRARWGTLDGSSLCTRQYDRLLRLRETAAATASRLARSPKR